MLERALERRRWSACTSGRWHAGDARGCWPSGSDSSWRRRVLRRIVDATLGNPLFALEIGRLLAAGGVGEDLPVPPAVEDLLGTRVSQAPRGARRLLLAVALGSDLPADELEAIAPVDVALDAGLLVADGERVRAAASAAGRRGEGERPPARASRAAPPRWPSSPASPSSARCTWRWRRPTRTRRSRPQVGRAAARGRRPWRPPGGGRARRAGAAPHRPRPPTPRASERLLTLAGYLEVAGERRQVRDLLLGAARRAPARRPARPGVADDVRGRRALARRRSSSYIERALDEAGEDPELRAHVLALKALNTVAEGVERVRRGRGVGAGGAPGRRRRRAARAERAGLGAQPEGAAARRPARAGDRVPGRLPRAGRRAAAFLAG